MMKTWQIGQSWYKHMPRLVDGTSTQWASFTALCTCSTGDYMTTWEEHMINSGIHANSTRERVNKLSQFITVLWISWFGFSRTWHQSRVGRCNFVLLFIKCTTCIIMHFTTSSLYIKHIFFSKWRIFIKYRYNCTLKKNSFKTLITELMVI